MHMLELTLVIGPCGSGKTAYARQHYPQHMHPDYERLGQSLFASPERFRFYPYIRTTGKVLYFTAIRTLAGKQVSMCVPDCGTTKRIRQQFVNIAREHALPIRCIRLLVDKETALARAKSDTLRPVSSRACWQEIIEHWFRDFEPVAWQDEGFSAYEEVSW
jgi:predicted kinase